MKNEKRMTAKARRILFTLSLVLLGVLNSADALTIRAGYPQLNGGQTPLWLIPDAAIGRQYGVDLHPVYIAGGALGHGPSQGRWRRSQGSLRQPLS